MKYVFLDGLNVYAAGGHLLEAVRRRDEFESVEQVCEWALATGVKTVYILPGSVMMKAMQRRKKQWLAETDWNIRPRDLAPVTTAWKRSGSRKVTIVSPGITDKYFWDLQDKKAMADFSGIVSRLIHHLQVDITTPIGTGKQIYDVTTAVKVPSLTPAAAQLFEDNRCQDLNYKRDIAQSDIGKLEAEFPYYFMVDRRHQYLSASGLVTLGIDAEPYHDAGAGQSFDKKRAGLWKIKITQPGVERYRASFVGELALPGYYLFERGTKWVYSPELELLLKDKPTEIKIEILESYTFQTSKRQLAGFSEKLLETRKALEASGVGDTAELLAHVKAIYTRFFGWLASVNPNAYTLHRPDWFYSIKAMAKANLIRNVYDAFFSPWGRDVMFIGARADCLCFLSATPFTGQILPNFARDKFSFEGSGRSADVLSIWNEYDKFHLIDDRLGKKGQFAEAVTNG